MASSKEEHFIEGIWGPYYNAMIPNHWLNEAGQSAAGKLLDHLIETHPAYNALKQFAKDHAHSSIYDSLDRILEDSANAKSLSDLNLLTQNLHIYPDFHGNRSPLADPNMLGQICGLNFDTSLANLATVYLAALQALAYQSKHIIDKMNAHNVRPKMMTIIGGLGQNRLYCRIQCDVCELPVLVPYSPDLAVLFGSAILGASNSSTFRNVNFRDLLNKFAASNSDAQKSTYIIPNKSIQMFHQQKYKIYQCLIEDQKKYRALMNFC